MRLSFFLWVSLLAFGLPEVFAGTGNGWVTNPLTYILVIPLYGLHFLLLCHIAIITKRTSWPALYLFGVIFGLYEAWITKVVWSGYPGSNGFAMGGFGQWFGVHETLGMVLFYHPVTSFLLPLAVLTRIFPAYALYFPAPDWVFGNSKWALARRVTLLLFWGLIAGHNIPAVEPFLVTWVPMIALLWLGYKFLKPRADFRATTPLLGKLGVWVVSVWLGLMYVVAYANLQAHLLPPLGAQAVTLALYLGIIRLIKRLPVRQAPAQLVQAPSPAKMPFKWLLILFAFGLAVSASIGAGVAQVVAVALTPFLLMVLLGAGLFIWLGLWKPLISK